MDILQASYAKPPGNRRRIKLSRRLFTAFGALFLAIAPAMAAERMTDFDPDVHGFAFANTFNNDFVRETDWRTSGLCGGMVYTALDFYRANKPIPRQAYRPATQTRLHDYIYDRQVNSAVDNADKWAELGFNPGGERNGDFFNWGLQGFGGGRLQELRASIDRGLPVPLGLWHYDGQRGGDHQVLAIGYDTGRYRGDLGRYREDLKIYIYDPNYPNEVKTLVPDLRLGGYRYTDEDKVWLTYFVDRKYRTHRPPAVSTGRESVVARTVTARQVKARPRVVATAVPRASGKRPATGLVTRELLVTIITGNDDLRGGSDNVNLIVNFHGRSPLVRENLNRGRRWLGNYDQTMSIRLPAAIALEDLSEVALTTRFQGGFGGDNWNVDGLKVVAVTDAGNRVLYDRSGTPLVRFTGELHLFRATLSP